MKFTDSVFLAVEVTAEYDVFKGDWLRAGAVSALPGNHNIGCDGLTGRYGESKHLNRVSVSIVPVKSEKLIAKEVNQVNIHVIFGTRRS